MDLGQLLDLPALARLAGLNDFGNRLAGFAGMEIYLTRFDQHPRWEQHPRSDKLLLGIEGKLRLTILSADEQATAVIEPGRSLLVPRGRWHSPEPQGEVVILSIADYAGTVTSRAEDPRQG